MSAGKCLAAAAAAAKAQQRGNCKKAQLEPKIRAAKLFGHPSFGHLGNLWGHLPKMAAAQGRLLPLSSNQPPGSGNESIGQSKSSGGKALEPPVSPWRSLPNQEWPLSSLCLLFFTWKVQIEGHSARSLVCTASYLKSTRTGGPDSILAQAVLQRPLEGTWLN